MSVGKYIICVKEKKNCETDIPYVMDKTVNKNDCVNN